MKIITSPKELQKMSMDLRRQGKTIALVPSMGYFHEGHLTLMEAAKKRADKVIVSLFVNPTQFGPGEDLDNYPQDLERDAELAREKGVDILFTPQKNQMYYSDHSTWIEVPKLAENLCAKSRPVHFRGVATVVTKLLMTALPDIAVFGEKDWQQLAIIKRMVRDLNIPVEIVGHPIVRNEDGLALSSRNIYLTDDEKKLAPMLQKGLRTIKELVDKGENDAKKLIDKLTKFYDDMIPGSEIDYIQIVHPENISIIEKVDGPALCAVAVRLGKARLIDNLLIKM